MKNIFSRVSRGGYAGAALALVCVIAIMTFLSPPLAHASFGDFFRDLVRPFRPQNLPAMPSQPDSSGPRAELSTTTPSFLQNLFAKPAEPDVPLYKPALDYEQAVIAAVKKASPAVVSIIVSKDVPVIENCPYNPFGSLPPEFQQYFGDGQQFFAPCEKGTRFQEIGGGSGFIISSDGLILTNKHVVSDTRASYTVFTNDGKKHEAKVLARDPSQDLAVVKIEATGLSVVSLGDSDSIELGQTAIAIGNALGEFRNTVSVGVISGLSRTITAAGRNTTETIAGVIQTDTAINEGNSGGPLLNLRGEVIGINTAVASGAENIGFAIPINRAKRDIASVKATGRIEIPFLGVRYSLLDEETAKEEDTPVSYGALVQKSDGGPAVEPGSPAALAGIAAGDIIVEINGKKIDRDNPLGPAIAQYAVGERIPLKIIRGTREIQITVVLAKRPDTL